MRVLVCGSFNLDHVWTTEQLPEPGATRSGRYASGPGGKGFNQAVGCARAGAATGFIGALGRDPAAELARSLAADNGIALFAQTVDHLPSGTAAVLVDGAGRNLIVVALGANLALSPAFVRRTVAAHRGADVFLAQLESPVDTIRAGLEAAREAGQFTVLNPAPADARVDAGLLAACELVTPNETEFVAMVAGLGGPALDAGAVAGLDDAALLAACRVLGCPRVLVTLGGAGCVLVADGRVTHHAAAPVACLDSTGAGDAFNGALCARLTEGATLDEAIGFATRYAGLSTERAGAALSMPTRAELDARFPAR
ncbi:MAG: ribokinase [Lysobacteraceae bacterium]